MRSRKWKGKRKSKLVIYRKSSITIGGDIAAVTFVTFAFSWGGKAAKGECGMIVRITGQVHSWDINGFSRRFAQFVLPFSEASQLFEPQQYNALKGTGQQRAIKKAHAKKLSKEIFGGNYTPTPIAAGISNKHLAALKIDDVKQSFTFDASSEQPLLLTDGDHRFAALRLIQKNNSDKPELLKAIDQLPIAITLYLNGDNQQDFVNLQRGASVDATHMLSLAIQQGKQDEHFERSFEVAKILNKVTGSPFYGQVRFDSAGVAPLPFSTLCAKGKSDIGTSLLGLSMVGSDKKPTTLADLVINIHKMLKNEAPELTEKGKPLASVATGGTKGSATMLIGLAVCAEYDTSRLDLLVESAKKTLDFQVKGNFSGPAKRNFLGAFAREFFGGEIPKGLIETLSESTFGTGETPVPVSEIEPLTQEEREAAIAATENPHEDMVDSIALAGAVA